MAAAGSAAAGVVAAAGATAAATVTAPAAAAATVAAVTGTTPAADAADASSSPATPGPGSAATTVSRLRDAPVVQHLRSWFGALAAAQPVYANPPDWDGWVAPSLGRVLRYLRERKPPARPAPGPELDALVPAVALDAAELRGSVERDVCATWIGHATVLVRMPGGICVLTDPGTRRPPVR